MARKRTTIAARVNTGGETLTAQSPAGKKVTYTRATQNFLTKLNGYIAKPPKTSVVMTITPEAAEAILRAYNKSNRPPKRRSIRAVQVALMANEFMVTGDTIKFNDRGGLADGQNRLLGCIEAGKPLITHVVFGVPMLAFDRMDTGAGRTAQDMLLLVGVKNPAEVAHIIVYMERQKHIQKDEPRPAPLQPYEIVDLAATTYKDVAKYLETGRELRRTGGLTSTRGAFLHYALARYSDKERAQTFMNAWLGKHALDEVPQINALRRRLTTISNAGKRPGARDVYTAAIVCYNCWLEGKMPRQTDLKERAYTPKIEQAA